MPTAAELADTYGDEVRLLEAGQLPNQEAAVTVVQAILAEAQQLDETEQAELTRLLSFYVFAFASQLRAVA